MKIVVAIDSFKGSLTTMQAGNAAREGALRVYPDATVSVCPLADGGEGTVSALAYEKRENIVAVEVTGPLGRPVTAEYCLRRSGTGTLTAVIEMAAAAGITLIPEAERDPMHTTTYGVGELIRDALKRGARSFIIGIGGSATNDCGIGMLQALGCDFRDENGNPVPFGAYGVGRVRSISTDGLLPALRACRIRVACDVRNVLCGKNGCSAVYGPQKGATPETVKEMDGYLSAFAERSREATGKDHALTPGVGAAGGLGYAFLTYLDAPLEPGIELVIRETGLKHEIRDADLVLTGEGRLDAQTAMGKAPAGVAAIAARYGVPTVALSGCVGDGAERVNDCGIHAFFPILRRPVTLEEAMDTENAYRNMADTAEQVIRLYKAFKG